MNSRNLPYFALAALLFALVPPVAAETPYSSSEDFEKYARKLRENALMRVKPQVFVPTTSRHRYSRYPWKRNIVTTVFWVGELPTLNNPTPNTASSWDKRWKQSFGGYDNPDPKVRKGYRPAAFVPRQNPFYIALPYNDIMRGGKTRAEAPRVVPWFRDRFVKQGHTVLKGRWVAIRKGRKICYAQWEDCGPFRTDHWQYVFGSDRPKWNINKGAGLDVSPAVRDYLGLSGIDITDWKFVNFKEVPRGPWSVYGTNNTFVIQKQHAERRYVELKSGGHIIRYTNL